MGKLLDKYTKPESTVKFQFPLSRDKLTFKRPSIGEIKSLQEFSAGLKDDDKADAKISAKILKLLCVDVAQESEKSLQDDITELEAPDRAAILPFYFELLGLDKDTVWKSVSENLDTTTKN